MNGIKQTVGVDVAQKELVCVVGVLLDDFSVSLKARKAFANNMSGFKAFLKWAKSFTEASLDLTAVLEATGVYHEKFVHWLVGQEQQVAIVLPNKISNYMRTLSIKTITDNTAAEAIAQFGLESKLETWTPPKPIFRKLKQLTRERDQTVCERVVVANQLHAQNAEAFSNANSLKRLKARKALLHKQEKEIKKEIHLLVKSDPNLEENISYMTSIPGVGELTAVIALAETNGFELVMNKRQLVSYAGLDIREKQSGTSVKGKPKISKKGNRHLRKSVHLPALCAIKNCSLYKNNFARLVGRHGIKMKAVVAVQRKILELMYILYKTKTVFELEYELKKEQQPDAATPLTV